MHLQNNNICDVTRLTYSAIISFHNEDYHRVQKSKDTYEDLIRAFLRYLASKGLCDIGLSLTLNKLLIGKIVTIPLEDLQDFAKDDCDSYAVTWDQITDFISGLSRLKYGKTVSNSSEHILTLLYIFQQMHHVRLNRQLVWHWFDVIRSLLGSGHKQHRRSLCQFLEYLKSGVIITGVTGDPGAVNSLDRLPDWMADPLKEYLQLLKREGCQPSTIAMYKSSNIRFCRYILGTGIDSFAGITPEVNVS